jgi:hypothetical protein
MVAAAARKKRDRSSAHAGRKRRGGNPVIADPAGAVPGFDIGRIDGRANQVVVSGHAGKLATNINDVK